MISTLLKKMMSLYISGDIFHYKGALFVFGEVSNLNSGAILK